MTYATFKAIDDFNRQGQKDNTYRGKQRKEYDLAWDREYQKGLQREQGVSYVG